MDNIGRNYEYDVVLSFAGEDRQYVEKVAKYLIDNGIKVFYDDYEKVDMWGKDLYVHLDDIYQNKGRHCVMFLSKNYANKLWTNHERESAQARAFEERNEYILPVKFDDTEIPGIKPTTGYIGVRDTDPEELGVMIIKKINKQNIEASPAKPFRKPKLKRMVSFNPYEEAQKIMNYIMAEIKSRCKAVTGDLEASIFDREGKKCIRVVNEGITKYSLDMKLGGMAGDSSLDFYGIEGEMDSFSRNASNASGIIKYSKEKGCNVINLQDMSFLEMYSAEEKEYTYEEFLDKIWERICNVLESDI